MVGTFKKRTFKKRLQKLRKTKRKHKRKPIFKKKFTKNKKKTKKIFLRKSSRKRRKHLKKYKGGFWTTCNKCMRKENCIGRACVNDCGYCTIQAFELPGINELFRDHQYNKGLSQQAFIKRVNKWLKNEGYNNLTVRENTIGSDTPQPSQVAKFLRDNGGDNEFIPICLGWPDGQSGHWLVGGRVNGEAVIIESQTTPQWMVEEDFEAYAKKNHRSKTVTIGLREEENLGLAQAKIYVWTQDKHDFIEQNTGENYFVVGKPLSRLTYYTIVGKDMANNTEHKIFKTTNGIEIRERESDGYGNVTVGKRVKRGDSYGLEDEDSSSDSGSPQESSKSDSNFLLEGNHTWPVETESHTPNTRPVETNSPTPNEQPESSTYHDYEPDINLNPRLIFHGDQEQARKNAIRNLQEIESWHHNNPRKYPNPVETKPYDQGPINHGNDDQLDVKSKVTCPGNHPLISFEAGGTNECGNCKTELPDGSVMYACELERCEYATAEHSICMKCEKKKSRRL
jgi:hypothetical protein